MYECYNCSHTVFEHEEQFGECRVYTWESCTCYCHTEEAQRGSLIMHTNGECSDNRRNIFCSKIPTKCECYHYETGSMFYDNDIDNDCLSKDG